jgi:hypothetical protein
VLNVDKVELQKKFKESNWEYVFKQAYEISEFVISEEFKIYDSTIKEEMKQECMENLWKKIIAGKCDPEQNLFSFFWKNSRFRILEMLRKENNRKRIATFVPYESKDYEIYKDENGIGERYSTRDTNPS